MLVQLITERERERERGGKKKGRRRVIFRLVLSYARVNAVDREMAIKEEGGCGVEGKRKKGTAVCSDSL